MFVGVSGYLAYKSIHTKKDLMVILVSLYLGLTPAILFFVDQIILFMICVALGLITGAIYNIISHLTYVKENQSYN
jgi:hypothetical protein